MISGTDEFVEVSLTQVAPGSIPQNAVCSSDIFDSVSNSSMRYLIRNIVPGTSYFVRISGQNQMGFGSRRFTAPHFLNAPLQKPGMPVLFFHDESDPVLLPHSPSSLMVKIGPPIFDGGLTLTYFILEWDTSPHFNSSLDGSALHSVRISALHDSPLCTACITT